MARLPQPGGDDGVWGAVLNDFLATSLNNDGTIKASAINSKLDASQKGQANGVASLGSDGRVPDTQAPSTQMSVSAWTQKGDIVVAADTNMPTALDAGSDGHVLTVDSTEPTGVKWAAPSVNNGNELAWNGSDYVPSSLKADTSKPRTFKGPVDPSTVPGVTMNINDWFDTWVGGA
jgi:hypothetical protein